MKTFLFGFLIFISSVSFAANELAEDIGTAALGAVGATLGGNAVGAAGALVGKYGTRAVDSVISNAIDNHFDKQDQDLSNKIGLTIHRDGKTISPQNDSSSDD